MITTKDLSDTHQSSAQEREQKQNLAYYNSFGFLCALFLCFAMYLIFLAFSEMLHLQSVSQKVGYDCIKLDYLRMSLKDSMPLLFEYSSISRNIILSIETLTWFITLPENTTFLMTSLRITPNNC